MLVAAEADVVVTVTVDDDDAGEPPEDDSSPRRSRSSFSVARVQALGSGGGL